ncbi:hypothetical protein [Mesorhizobium caraganae]|uniref:hypothetical protein n=1 Tax=Mesorhizobium caraganae TaxID=483206 RepID=UPI003ECCC9A9
MPRVLAWLGSETHTVEVQPIVANGSVLEDVSFFWDHSFVVEADEYSFKESIFRTGNEAWFDLTIGWKDVFDRQHEFTVSMSAVIDASPSSPKKRRSRTGKMEIRMDDPRFRDIGPKADG